MKKHYVLSTFFVCLLSGCVSDMPSGTMDIQKASFSEISGWNSEQHQPLLTVLHDECHRLAQLPSSTALGGASSLPYGRKAKDWQGVCLALSTQNVTTDEQAQRFIETWFQPYKIATSAFYTGYSDPEVDASLKREGPYQTPIYRRPPDLLRGKTASGEVQFGHWVNSVFQPYDDRAAINAGSLVGKGLEVAWVKNHVDLLFLQVQGSGRLHLPDGQEVHLAYDGRNGHPYVPIGRILVQRHYMKAEDVTESSIRAWVSEHPDEANEILNENPSYVFFRPVERSDLEGPAGAFGVPLTPGRSIAVDKRLVPYAMPVWVDTSFKDAHGQPEEWKRLMFAQDSGAEIRGIGRGDLFLGWGPEAQKTVGNLKSSGKMMILVPKQPERINTDISASDLPQK